MQRQALIPLFRYFTHIDTSHAKQEWNNQLEQKMLSLHQELGNKWAVIGHRMGGMYLQIYVEAIILSKTTSTPS